MLRLVDDASQTATKANAPAAPAPKPWVTWSLVLVNVAVWLVMVARGVSPIAATVADLESWGADVGYLTLGEHQWWRLITSVFVHVAIWHVALNMVALL